MLLGRQFQEVGAKFCQIVPALYSIMESNQFHTFLSYLLGVVYNQPKYYTYYFVGAFRVKMLRQNPPPLSRWMGVRGYSPALHRTKMAGCMWPASYELDTLDPENELSYRMTLRRVNRWKIDQKKIFAFIILENYLNCRR